MSGLPLSGATRALLEAAKHDAPAAMSRAKIWSGVATTAGIGVAAGTTSVAVGAGASASKLIAMGALLGSAITVGVTLALLRVTSPSPTAPATHAGHEGIAAITPASPGGAAPAGFAAAPTTGVAGAAMPAFPSFPQANPPAPSVVAASAPPEALPATSQTAHPSADPASAQGTAPGTARTALGTTLGMPTSFLGASGPAASLPSEASPQAHTRAGASTGEARAGAVHTSAKHGAADARGDTTALTTDDDPLMREAALVAEARGSLVRGDALGALRTIRATASRGHRELEPEELSIESRALRALGREAEAEAVDVALRARYPDHALSR